MKSSRKNDLDLVRKKIDAALNAEIGTSRLADELRRLQEEAGAMITEEAISRELIAVRDLIRLVPDLLARIEAAPVKPAHRRRILSVLRALLVYWKEENDLLPDSLGLPGLIDDAIVTLALIERLNDWYADAAKRPLLEKEHLPSNSKLRCMLSLEVNCLLDRIIDAIWDGEDFLSLAAPVSDWRQAVQRPPMAQAKPEFREAGRTAPQAAAAPEAPRVYDVWFATNRKPVAANDPAQGFGNEREADGAVHYGLCAVEIPKHHNFGSVGTKWWKRWLKLKFTDDQLKIVRRVPFADADVFFDELRAEMAALAANDRQILFYLHGFNVAFDEAAIRAAQIGIDLQVPGVTAFFSWPSKASPDGYFADADRIAASEREIAAFLMRLASDAGGAVVHIIAHSMGNRGLARAIQRISTIAAAGSGIRFGQIILAAPDLEVELFRDLAAVFPKVSRRTTMYVSGKDRALGLSKWIQDSDRAGFAPPVTVVPQVDTVEVTDIDVTLLGHGYYAEAEPVMYDINDLLRHDSPPDRRMRLEPAVAGAGGRRYWVIHR